MEGKTNIEGRLLVKIRHAGSIWNVFYLLAQESDNFPLESQAFRRVLIYAKRRSGGEKRRREFFRKKSVTKGLTPLGPGRISRSLSAGRGPQSSPRCFVPKDGFAAVRKVFGHC